MKISPHDNPSLDEKHPTPPQSPSLPWEESEQYQRFQARTIVVLFVVVVVSCALIVHKKLASLSMVG